MTADIKSCVKKSSSDVTGAILVLGRDLVMVPKLIHPLPPAGPGTPKSPAYGEPIEEEPPTPHPMTDTWMQVQFKHSRLLIGSVR